MGEKWPKIDHIAPHFCFGTRIPHALLGSRCSFPSVFRVPVPSSVRRRFEPRNWVLPGGVRQNAVWTLFGQVMPSSCGSARRETGNVRHRD